MSAHESSQVAVARERAKRIGLRVSKNGDDYTLYDGDAVVVRGPIEAVESYIGERYQCRPPRGQRWVSPPEEWASHIDDYLTTLAAGGRSPETIRLRRESLVQMSREIGGSPADVTSDQLIAWLGSHPGWGVETRKNARGAARLFFLWAYKTGRVPVHIADDLPAVRVPPPTARAAPDHVWEVALASADARTTLMLRLAAQAGLRRGEISQVHVRDLIESGGHAKLLVSREGRQGSACAT